MATANQNSSAPNKAPLFQKYGGIHKDSPQSVTPQNFKISHIQTTKAEANLLDTAKTSTKSQSGPHSNLNRQIMTLQNSQIHGRKVDSPKIYVYESEIHDSRPKTSAQCNRKIKNKRSKVPQIPTPANVDKKAKNLKKDKNGSHTAQNTSGSCLTIFPAHPVSSRKPNQKFDFTFNQEKEDLEAGAANALPITERDVKRKHNSNISDMQASKDQCNLSMAQLSHNTTNLSRYQQSRQLGSGATRTKSSGATGRIQRNKQNPSHSMHLGVTSSVKPNVNQSINTPSQLHSHASGFNATQSQLQGHTKTVKTQRQPKYNQRGIEESSKGRRARSSDQKSRPTLAAASKKGMTIRKSKPAAQQQKSTMSNFANNYNQKQSQSQGATGVNIHNRKSSSIESQSKLHGPQTVCDGLGQFSFDIDQDNKENYPSNSSLHQGKSKPLSEQSKSISAGRPRNNHRNPNLKNDLSLSDLSRGSLKEVKASGGSLSKSRKPYLIHGEHILNRLLSPGPVPGRADQRKRDLDLKMLSASRTSSPTKFHGHQSRPKQQRSAEAGKQTQEQAANLKQVKVPANQVTSLDRLQGKPKKPPTSTEKPPHQLRPHHLSKNQQALDQMKQFMHQTQHKPGENHLGKDTQHHHDISQHSKQKSKKKRPQSEMSKSNVLSYRNHNPVCSKDPNQMPADDALSGSFKQRVKDPSCIGEINKLKNEISDELKREKLNVMTPQGVQKPTITSSKNKQERKPSDTANSGNKFSSLRTEQNNKIIQHNLHTSTNQYSKQAHNDVSKAKIQRYIEKQKKLAAQKENAKRTIEHDKVTRVRAKLLELQELPSKRPRQKSKTATTTTNAGGMQHQRGPASLNIKNSQKSEPGFSHTQKIELLNNKVTTGAGGPAKNLRANYTRPLKNKKSSIKTTTGYKPNQHDSSMMPDMNEDGDENGQLDEVDSQQDGYPLQQPSDMQVQDHSMIGEQECLNIFRKDFNDSSKQNSQRINNYMHDTGHQEPEFPPPHHQHGFSGKNGLSLMTGQHTTQPIGHQQNAQGKSKQNKQHIQMPDSDTYDRNITNHQLHPPQQQQSFEESYYGPGSYEPSDQPSAHSIHHHDSGIQQRKGMNDQSSDSKEQNYSRQMIPGYPGHPDQIDMHDIANQSLPGQYHHDDEEDSQEEYANNAYKSLEQPEDQRPNSSPQTYTEHSQTDKTNAPRNQIVPQLNLEQIHALGQPSTQAPSKQQKPSRVQLPPEQLQSESARTEGQSSIFTRPDFRDQLIQHPINPSHEQIHMIPELFKIHEEAIRKKQLEDQTQLQFEFDNNQVTPRTYKRKHEAIECWVSNRMEKIQKQKEMASQKPEGTIAIRDDHLPEHLLEYIDRDAQILAQVSARLSQRSNSRQSKYLKPSKPIDEYASSRRQERSVYDQSSRRSHKTGTIIEQIYEKPTSQNGESSRDKWKEAPKNNNHLQVPDGQNSNISHSQPNSQNYGSQQSSSCHSNKSISEPDQDNKSLNEVEIPVPQLNSKSGLKDLMIDPNHSANQLASDKSEKSISRHLSQQRLKTSDPDLLPSAQETEPIVEKDDKPADPPIKQNNSNNTSQDRSPKQLVKNQGLSSLHGTTFDEESEKIDKQIEQMEQSKSLSDEGSKNNTDDLDQIRDHDFFLKTTNNDPKKPCIQVKQDPSQGQAQITNQLTGSLSPFSGASSDYGIKHGGQSLESSTSGENHQALKHVIDEIKHDGTFGAGQAKTDDVGPSYQPSISPPTMKVEDQMQNSLPPQMAEYAEALSAEIMQVLLAEMQMDFELLVNRDQAQAIQNQQQDQGNMQVQLQGIKTDLFAIERYVDEIITQIKENSAAFLSTLNKPLTKDHIEHLKQLHDTEVGSCKHFEEQYPNVLPLDLYLTLEKQRKERREREYAEQNGGNQPAATAGSQHEMYRVLIAECEHIHNKVLFDCINDSLLQFKPYGKEGEPLPFQRKNRRLKPSDDFSVNEIFEIVKHDLFRWAITQAGTLPRREFVYRGVFDEELFSEIREKKLVALLGREMIETEPRWLNYEFEQAQVKMDLSDNILEILVTECIEQLNQLEQGQEEDLSQHPLMRKTSPEEEEKKETEDSKEQGRPRQLEAYEEHILQNIGVGGADGRPGKNSHSHSGYNSKDSDFSNNFEGSEAAEDFGGNHSHEDSNSHYDDDDF